MAGVKRWRGSGGALWVPIGILFLCCSATPALAAEGGGTIAGGGEAVFLAQLLALMLCGRLLGEAMQRIGQPSVMGQLLAGILLGPSVLGWIWPNAQHWLFPASQEQKSMLDAVSQFGILLLLLLTGMETDLKLVSKVGRAAISISLLGVAVPFACGTALGAFIPTSLLPNADKRLITSLFLGTALSISSIKIVATIIREMNFMRRNLGQVIMASAILEDTMGWIIISLIFGLGQAGTFDISHAGKSLLGTIAFLIASFTVGRRAVFWLIRFVNDNFISDFPVITMILAIMAAMALITARIGVQTVLGAFVAGVLIGESPILSKHVEEQLRGLVIAFFMPVFFAVAGLNADMTVFRNPSLLLMAVVLIAIASFGKFTGAFLGGAIGGLRRAESVALACAMNARGSTEVIVASIGLSMGALSGNLFTMIVAMAAATTLMMPPMLRWALRRVPMRRAEKERLEREEMEARGFVPNLERLLLAVDESPNGKFASRIAGHLAGPRGLPITVLSIEADDRGNRRDRSDPDRDRAQRESVKDAVKAAAEKVRAKQPQEGEPAVADVTVRRAPHRSEASAGDVVAQEARKGYDLLFIGLKNLQMKGGGFHPQANNIAAAFSGPLAIVAARGIHLRDPAQGPLNILVPVNGSGMSRRAAELAIAVARVSTAALTVLYVSNVKAGLAHRGGLRVRRQEQAILKDIVDIADQYDFSIRTAVRSDIAPDEAVLAEAKRGRHNLIIMGVGRRSGDTLFFGETASSIFEHSPDSIVFVVS
jgi:Kef-type K+ transport system membrane component KefB/nucleotide-binding universal stress UspA family protein